MAAQEGKGAGVLPGNASLLPLSPTRGFPRKEYAPCAWDLTPLHSAFPHALLGRRVWSGYPQRQCWSCMDWGTRGLVTAALNLFGLGVCSTRGKGDEWKGTLVTPTFRQGTCQKVVNADNQISVDSMRSRREGVQAFFSSPCWGVGVLEPPAAPRSRSRRSSCWLRWYIST